MNTTDFYSPRRQLHRALASDWRLYGNEMLYGLFYILMSFYCFRRLGLSQVYDVISPFIVAAAVTAFLTWRICSSDVDKKTGPYFASLPRDRDTAFGARILLTAYNEILILRATYTITL